MKIKTKAMITMLVVTMLAMGATNASALGSHGTSVRRDRKLERLHHHHDRKFELRASILGMTHDQLRDELKHKTFNQILQEKGFSNHEGFLKALEGKLRVELKKRGYSDEKINQYLKKRQDRLDRHLQQSH